MATFDEFYASLDPDIGIRGKQFEKFVKWFLKTDPTWACQIDEVWHIGWITKLMTGDASPEEYNAAIPPHPDHHHPEEDE